MRKFELVADYLPAGHQPRAIAELTDGIRSGHKSQTLLGVTGSGKTFTIANVVAEIQMPTLVISHNKTLAAQLYGELKEYFPRNAVEYFISYYDYYQPEAYIPVTDTYIEKDATINDDIERLRLRTTSALIERQDVIVVASVSSIYGLGSPKEYAEMHLIVEAGERIERDAILRKLVDIHYTRNDIEFAPGTFRVRGDVIEVMPAYDETAYRIELFGDEIERLTRVHPLRGAVLEELDRIAIYPAKHFVTTYPTIERACKAILLEMEERVAELRAENQLVEAQRLETRTRFDVEMLLEVGYCSGVENYSRHISGRKPGERPAVLLDYFPSEFLTIIDESHATTPQVHGMYAGDRSRKEQLVRYGFRLPSALDNRPLNFNEFEATLDHRIFVSATPGDYELENSGGVVVEQIIRPTGLLDPKISVRPVDNQVDDLLEEVRVRVSRRERVLVTTLTKRMAEDLADYLAQMGIRVRYLHSEIDALERVVILRGLRLAEFDVLVGINLLREGLDLPEVSLVAILDADKEGYLRSERSLIQTAGRAARNAEGEAILYADRITDSMRKAIDETERRRLIQETHNREHDITPRSIVKSPDQVLKTTAVADQRTTVEQPKEPALKALEELDHEERLTVLRKLMKEASARLEFEQAAELRDEIARLTTSQAVS